MKEMWLCHVNCSSSRSPRNFICSESVGVPVRLIIVLFSTNAFSGILGIFVEELNTEYFVLDTFSDNLDTFSDNFWCIAIYVFVLRSEGLRHSRRPSSFLCYHGDML